VCAAVKFHNPNVREYLKL